MRFSHDEMPRSFKVPLGPWLIPASGILLCILLLINISKGTGIRFGIWMGIGHVVYFFFGLRHSNIRSKARVDSLASELELNPEPMKITIDDGAIQESTYL